MKSHSKCILFVGGVGSGKTLLALDTVWQDFKQTGQKKLFTNHPVRKESLPDVDIVEWSAMEETLNFTCGVWFVDECDNWLNSRKASSLSDDARTKIKEHRKDHLTAYFTTQHVSMVDRVFRFFFDEVRVVERYTIPLVAWFAPRTRRPTRRCKHCGKVPPDGWGDDSNWFKRLLGFGTLFTWKVYPKDVLGEVEGSSAEEVELKGIEPIGGGWKFFNNEMIERYDTGYKTSRKALNDAKSRGTYQR